LSQNEITSYQQEWYDELVNQPIRSSVDELVMERIKIGHVDDVIEEEKPSWVMAALDVFKDKVDGVTEAIEEMFEDVEDIPLVEEESEDGIEQESDGEGEDDKEQVEEIEEEEEETESQEAFEEIAIEEPVISDIENPFGGEIDYNSYTVRELQQECKNRGITIRGTKSEVVLRLRRDDMGIVEQPTQAESDAPSQEAADEKAVAPSQEAASKDVTQYDDSRQEQPDNEEE